MYTPCKVKLEYRRRNPRTCQHIPAIRNFLGDDLYGTTHAYAHTHTHTYCVDKNVNVNDAMHELYTGTHTEDTYKTGVREA